MDDTGRQSWNEIHKMLDEATAYITSQVDHVPSIGIILGTGLGSLVDGMEMAGTIEYDRIPHFPVSTVESHHGRLLLGTLKGKPVTSKGRTRPTLRPATIKRRTLRKITLRQATLR